MSAQSLARKAGDGGKEAEAEEAAALADEADMPIEQLLARYGITRDAAGGPSPSSAAVPALGQGALRRAARGQRRQAPLADGEPAAQPAAAEPLAKGAAGTAEDGARRPAKRRRADGGECAQEAPLATAGHGVSGMQRPV